MAETQLTQTCETDDDAFVDDLRPGTELMRGQYRIESFLNAGGFGVTYRARDSLDRKVVIKECFPGAFCRRSSMAVTARSRAHLGELKNIVSLFVEEARSLARLSHPNIVGVHQVFEENNTAYMALDFVGGRDLLDIIEDPNTTLTPARVERLLRVMLGAVGYVHSKGMLHRDVSPDNILVRDDGTPVLIDFGAAREEATKKSRALSALRVVKDGYSPQEFYVAGSQQGPFSDLYALGASFYHLIAGKTPPNSQVRLAAIAAQEPDPYVPLSGAHDAHDPAVLASIDKALAILPKDRIQTAGEWVTLLDGPGNVLFMRDRPGRGTGRSGTGLAVFAAAALLGSAAIAYHFGVFSDDTPGAIFAEDPVFTAGSDADRPGPAAIAVSPHPRLRPALN